MQFHEIDRNRDPRGGFGLEKKLASLAINAE